MIIISNNQTIVIDIVARLKDEVSGNINALNAAFSSTQSSANSLNNSINATAQSAASLAATADSAQTSATGLAGGIDGAQRSTTSLGNSTNRTRTSTDRFLASMRRTEQQAQRLTRDRWIMRLDMVDRSAQSIQKVTNSIGNISNKTFSFTMKMTDLATKPLQGLMKLASNPIVAFGSVAGVSVGIKDTIDTFGNFEQTMANVHAITKSSDQDFKELRDTAMHLGETTVFSANETAQGMTYLGMAGWKKDTIKAAMPDMLNLSSASQTDLATTSDIVSDVMTAFGIDPTDMYNKDKSISATGHVADVFAATVTGSNTDMTMLGETMKYAAPIAKKFNMSLEDTAGMAGMMANAGIKSSQAGTTLRGAMTRLAKKPKEAKEELERFNINLSDKTTGNIRPITDIVTDLSDAFSHLTQEEKLSSASKIFGVNAVSGWLAVLDQGPDKLREFTKSLREADGAAKKMADIQLDTLQGSFKLLQSAAEGVKIRVGDRLAPTLRRFTDFITNNMPSIERVILSGVDNIVGKFNTLENNVHKLTDSFEWKNADSFSDKFTLAWDKIIAEPFQSWWSGSGQSFMADVANKVGSGIGGLYKGLAGLVFGFEDDDTGAVGIGKSFADGFIEGFDPETTAKRVMNGIGNIFSHSHFNIFGDKEDKSIVSTLMAGFMINKGLQLTGSIAGSVGTGARVLGGLIGGSPVTALASTTSGASRSEVMRMASGFRSQGMSQSEALQRAWATVGAGGAGAGMAGAGSTTVVAGAGAGSLLMPAALIGSFASATGGIVSAASDFKDASNTENKKLKRDSTYKGATKTALVAGGAALGTLLFPGLGTGIGMGAGALLGAGIGGLGALFKGNDLGKWFSDISDGTAEIDKMTESFKEAAKQADKMKLQDISVQGLIDEYYDLNYEISYGKLSIAERTRLEKEQKEVLEALAEIYPDLIDDYDIQNGKLYTTLKNIEEISKLNRDLANTEILVKGTEARMNLPDLSDRYYKSKEEEQRFKDEAEYQNSGIAKYQSIQVELLDLQKDAFLASELGNFKELENINPQIDAWLEKAAKLASERGDNISTFNIESFGESIEILQKRQDRTLASYNAQTEQTSKLETELTANADIMERWVLLVNGLEGNFEEVSKTYSQMDEKQKASYENAKSQYQEITNRIDNLPKELFIPIHMYASYEAYGDSLQNIMAKESEKYPLTNPMSSYRIERDLEQAAKKNKSLQSTNIGISPHSPNYPGFATGGILTSPQFALVAEAGPEAIIPLSGANRERGVELWHQAGDRLGMFEEQKEIPTSYIGETRYDFLNSEEEAPQNPISPVSVTLTGGVNITINGGTNLNDGKAIVKAIREQMPTIADELCEEIAIGVKKAFDNMPLASG